MTGQDGLKTVSEKQFVVTQQLNSRIFFTSSPHLHKSDFAVTDITAAVPDGDLPVVLDPALSAQNVVDARCHLVPLIVVSKSRQGGYWKGHWHLKILHFNCHCCCSCERVCVCAVPRQWDSRFSPWQIYMGGANWNNLHWLPPELVLTPHICKINQKKGNFAHFNLSVTISRYRSWSDQCPYSTTLPVDEVFRLCITSWNRRVMTDLVSTKEGISWVSEVTELTLSVTVIAALVMTCKISNSRQQIWGVVHTCSATNRKPLSGRSHSYVSPRTGLKGFPPVL